MRGEAITNVSMYNPAMVRHSVILRTAKDIEPLHSKTSDSVNFHVDVLMQPGVSVQCDPSVHGVNSRLSINQMGRCGLKIPNRKFFSGATHLSICGLSILRVSCVCSKWQNSLNLVNHFFDINFVWFSCTSFEKWLQAEIKGFIYCVNPSE